MMYQIKGLSLVSKALLYLGITLSIVIAVETLIFSQGKAIGDVTDKEMTGVAEILADARAMTPPYVPRLAEYSEITDRPVFSETRRSPPPGVTLAMSTRGADQMSKQWKLTGVAVAGADTYVFVEGKRDRRTVRLQQGELLDGWRIDEIGADQITLISGNNTVSLKLHEDIAQAQ
jgi:hypothetical protein